MSNAIDQQVSLTNEFVAILREEIGYHEQFAVPIAESIVRGLAKRCSGDRIYIPVSSRARNAERDRSIRAEFNGKNAQTLCSRYGIGRSRLYEIVGEK